MKRPLQLPLAIALALGGTNALALGLGPVHVNSRLNQPLDAEIPVIQGSAGEAEGLLVSLAAADDFERIGLSRSRLTVPLEFTVVKGARGEPVIKVTSKEPVRDSYVDFLLEANWPKGRLLREYTILLDPPLVAPATRGATTSPVMAPPPVKAVTREPRPEAAPAAAPRPRARAAAAEEPVAKVAAGDYGPVQAGETLSGIARARGQGSDLNRMMLAIWKQNPDAFYKNNINALKRGAILRIPSAEEVRAVGDAREAAAQVQAQIEDWRGGRATATQVAGADVQAAPAPKKTVAGTTTKPTAKAPSGERLELVPPKAGKDSLAMADRPGSGAGSAAAGELKSELARTKEALTAREQETGELKSRVRELEDLKGKNDRLISLKDSEIAELQQKLKALQEKSGAPAEPAKPSPPKPAEHGDAAKSADTPVAAVAAPPADKIEKKDIWGDAAATSATPVSAPKSAQATAPTAANAATPTASAPATTPADGSAAAVAATATPVEPKPTDPAATATATPAVAPATPPPPPATAPKPAAPASTAAPKPVVKKPVPRAPEWYEAPWVLPAALGAGVLALLGLLFGMRKRKPVPAVAGGSSIADAFGDSPLGPPGHAVPVGDDPEEARLLDQLRADPGNTGLHLELLSLYYAARRTADFERAAATMREHVVDIDEPEWQEALEMGRELAPHDPLFAAPRDLPAFATIDEEVRHAFDDEPAAPAPRDTSFAFDPDLEHFGALGTQETTPAPDTSALADDLDFGLPSFETPAPTPPASLDDAHVPPPAVETHLDDGLFGGNDDAIGTKLDLAKAYMDMGDPEGARSMLEEVVAEGSELQRAEAHRLMAELR